MNYHFTCLVTRFLLRRIPFAQRALLILLLTTGLVLFGSQHITRPQPVYAAAMEVDRPDDEPTATACTAAVNDCSLRGAILAANSLAGPDTINVPAGTYTLTMGSELILTSEITLVGAGAATTIVQASTTYNIASHRVMSISSGATVIISGLTIRYGKASNGGGIYNDSGVLTLQDRVVVSANSAAGSHGGGIYNTGTLTITGPGTIIGGDSRAGLGNSAGSGGGIYNDSGTVTIIGAGTIIGGDNRAGLGNWALLNGGGIYITNNSTVTIEGGAAVPGNSVDESGGGIYNIGTLTVTGAGTIVGGDSTAGLGNSARMYGGGIYNTSSVPVRIEGGAAVSGNSSASAGGGIYSTGTLTITGPGTIIGGDSRAGLGNWSRTLYGGGIYNYRGTVTIQGGAAVSGNSARSIGGVCNYRGTLTITGAGTIIGGDSRAGLGNLATENAAGGIANTGGTLTISDGAAVSGNSAHMLGGGILNNDGGTLMITGAGTIIGGDRSAGLGNWASVEAGGIHSWGGTLTISDGAAVSGNSARDGGGIYSTGSSGTVTITDSILSDNQGGAWESGGLGADSIRGSCIVNNSPIAVEDLNRDSPRLVASGNWWGATNGPGPVGPGSGDTINFSVDISGSFLTAPPAGLTCATTSITLAGTVYRDDNNDGILASSELGISGVTITASGTDSQGMAVTRTITTAADGTYRFELPAGTYRLTETQPGGYIDGLDTVGSLGGTLTPPDTISAIAATTQGTSGTDYNFGERWPTLRISGPLPIPEGNSGETNATFTVTLSAWAGVPVSVHFATGAVGDTAQADIDYTSTNAELSFTSSTLLSQSISVPVRGDRLDEADETFTLALSGAANAIISGTGTATGTIIDDDTRGIVVAVTDNQSSESGNTASFNVHLATRPTTEVTISFTSTDPSEGAAPGDITFTTTNWRTDQPVTITGVDDDIDDGDILYTVTLSAGGGDYTGQTVQVDLINLDNDVSQISISDVTVTEGNSGTVEATFTVSLSHPSTQTIMVNYTTADDSATTADNDYAIASGTLTFPPSDLSETVTVVVNGDTTRETNEYFFVNLNNASNATIVDGRGIGTITNDDGVPQLSIDDVRVTEGNSGEVKAIFAVTLSHPTYQTVTVDYATADDSATITDQDYRSRAGTLTFAPGTVRKTIAVTVYGDTRYELDESFIVTLSGARFAMISDNQGLGTIVNDDSPPVLSIDDVTVFEPGSGKGRAVFTVSLDMPIGLPVTVVFASADGTATVNNDYAPAAGTLTFMPGATRRTVIVSTLSDTVAEGAETFLLNLSQPTNATIGDVQGTGIIRDQVPTLRAPANQSEISNNTPTLIWNTLRDATHYRLQLDNNADFSSPQVTRVLTETRYTLPTTLPDRTYYWRVQARDVLGNWGGWSSRWTFTVDTLSLAAPVLLSPANGSVINGNRPIFRWQAVFGATSYTLQVDNQSNFASPVISTTLATTRYASTTPLAAGTYYWRVRTEDAAGHQSSWSSPWRFTIASAAVLPLSPALNTPTRIPAAAWTVTPTPTTLMISLTATPTDVTSALLQRVESTDSVVVQAGTWTAHTTDVASGGSYVYSSGSFNDILSLRFLGTQVEVIYVKHPALGTFAVEVDGALMQIVSSVAAESEFSAQTLVSGLSDGPHTLKVYPVAGVVAFDAFGVGALVEVVPTPTPTEVPLDQSTPNVTPTDEPTMVPTDVPPDQPTFTPTATNTPLLVTLPFIETFDSDLNWQATGAWSFDTQTAYRGAGWFASSTTRGQSSMLTFMGRLDLGTALNPELSFLQKTELASVDLFALEVSKDSGVTWLPLESQNGQVSEWIPRTQDLTAYRGQVIALRFRLDTLNILPESAVTMGVWIDGLVIQEAQPTPTLTQISTDIVIVTDQPTNTSVPPTATDIPTNTPIPTDVPTSTPVPTETPTNIPTATPTEAPASEVPAPDATEASAP